MKRKKNDENEEQEQMIIEPLSSDVTSNKNKVYFHCDVSRKNVMLMIQELDKAVKYVREYMDEDSKIHLYIHSEGGDLYSGLSGMNHIKNCRVPVVTHVDGICASAATDLLMGGYKRVMSKYSQVLIHQLSSGVIGKYEEIKEETENCTKLMQMMRDIYNEHCKIPKKMLDKLLSKEIYLNADECLKYKIIDEIV